MASGKFPLLEKCNPKNCLVSKTMKINRLMNQIFRKHLAEIDITLSQLSIMFMLCKRQLVSQSDLGEALYLEKSTVTRNLNRLINKDLVIKESNKMIRPTNKGMGLVEKTIPKWEDAMNEARIKIAYDGEESIGLLLNKLSS